MFRKFIGASAVLFLIGGVSAWSQAPGPGPGGRGGRFMLGGGPGGAGMLVMLPEVQKEIGVREDQQKPLAEWQEKQQTRLEAVMEDFDPRGAQDLEPEEREQKFAEMRTKMDKANAEGEALLGKLLDDKQRARLEQLRLQREGVAAFDRPKVAEKLKLTAEQQEKIRGSQDQFFGGFGPPRQNPEALTKAVAVLTKDQQAAWLELTGTEFKFPEQGFGPGGRGPGGPGGMFGGEDVKLAKEFDTDKNGWLSAEERVPAKEALQKRRTAGGGRGPGGRGPGGPGGRGPREGEAGKPGPRVTPSDVAPIEGAKLYDEGVLRTLFLDFENDAWEDDLADFHNTDVEIPATLTVDGKKYPQVGVHFRGMSSYGGVPKGSKRSMNVSLDFVDQKQRLLGYKTLNLLNAHEDPTFMHTVLYSHIARQHIPAPKANFVKVVINGESWGVYTSAQQFDKVFVQENFPATGKSKVARWKVRGSPGGDGGLRYTGDNVAEYKRRYELKSDEDAAAWDALVKLCKTLQETPADKLEEALKPMLDIDGALWFLALDNALINCDGYWIRASDYCLVRDSQGVFHIVPHDMNETFQTAMGPGMGGAGGPGGRGPGGPGGRGPGGPGAGPGGPGAGPGGPGGGERGGRGAGGGFTLDPLVGLNDASKPLRAKLLSVPSLRAKYLAHVKEIAEESLAPEKLNPVVAGYRSLIEKELEADTRKLSTFAAFTQATDAADTARGRNVLNFARERRKYLLEYKEPEAK